MTARAGASRRKRARASSSPSIVVRDACSGDRRRLERWHRDLQVHLSPMIPGYAMPDVPTTYGPKYVSRALALLRKHGGFALVAELEGRPVGFLTGFLQPVPAEVSRMEQRPNQQGYVMDILVEKEARGRGAGRALLREADRRFLEMGCDNVQLNVLVGNRGARRVYERAGFREIDLRLRKVIASPPRGWLEVRARRRAGRRRARGWRPLLPRGSA